MLYGEEEGGKERAIRGWNGRNEGSFMQTSKDLFCVDKIASVNILAQNILEEKIKNTDEKTK